MSYDDDDNIFVDEHGGYDYGRLGAIMSEVMGADLVAKYNPKSSDLIGDMVIDPVKELPPYQFLIHSQAGRYGCAT